jgi:hypothetical protein
MDYFTALKKLEKNGITPKELTYLVKEIIIALADDKIMKAVDKRMQEEVKQFKVISKSEILKEIVLDALRKVE